MTLVVTASSCGRSVANRCQGRNLNAAILIGEAEVSRHLIGHPPELTLVGRRAAPPEVLPAFIRPCAVTCDVGAGAVPPARSAPRALRATLGAPPPPHSLSPVRRTSIALALLPPPANASVPFQSLSHVVLDVLPRLMRLIRCWRLCTSRYISPSIDSRSRRSRRRQSGHSRPRFRNFTNALYSQDLCASNRAARDYCHTLTAE